MAQKLIDPYLHHLRDRKNGTTSTIATIVDEFSVQERLFHSRELQKFNLRELQKLIHLRQLQNCFESNPTLLLHQVTPIQIVQHFAEAVNCGEAEMLQTGQEEDSSREQDGADGGKADEKLKSAQAVSLRITDSDVCAGRHGEITLVATMPQAPAWRNEAELEGKILTSMQKESAEPKPTDFKAGVENKNDYSKYNDENCFNAIASFPELESMGGV